VAKDYEHQYPTAAGLTGKHFYVDDVLTGAATME